jgi:hypothetical protein
MIDTKHVANLQSWSGRIGHGFLILATFVTGYAGWVWGGDNVFKSILLMFVMGMVPAAVAYMLPFISIARQSGRPFTAITLSLALAVAAVMELRGELMVFAGHRQTSASDANLQKARLNDARNAVRDLENRLKVVQAKLEEQAPYGPSSSYDDRIKDAEDLAARESSAARKGCLKKCDDAKKAAADFRAKRAIALDREKNTEPAVESLTAELKAARETAGKTKAGDSMSEAEADIIASFFTMSLNPGEDARAWTDRLSGAFMALFLLIVPTTLIFTSKMDWTPRQRSARRNIFVSFAQFCRRMYCHATGTVIIEAGSHTREMFDAKGVLMGAYRA